MTHNRSRLLGAGLSAALAAGTLLATPPAAHAAPVFSYGNLDMHHSHYSTGTCTDLSAVTPAPADAAVVENGPAATGTAGLTATYRAAGDVTDTITGTVAIAASTTQRSAGGLPQSIDLSYTGSLQVTASKPTSGCSVQASAEARSEFELTLTQPMWVTVARSNRGPSEAGLELEQNDGDAYLGAYGDGLGSTGTTTAYLPAGEYDGSLYAEVARMTDHSSSGAASGRVTVTFATLGSATSAPSGKAAKYVALPSGRACAGHTATATLTTKKKLVRQIEKVTFTVDGKKAATLKGKKVKKGRVVALVLADNAPAAITATVTLANGKKRSVQAAYRACSS